MAEPADSSTPAPDPLVGLAPALLAVLGLGFGASVFAEGFYAITVWGPIAAGLLALLLALAVGAPVRPRGPAALALAALVALWLWSWISASWAASGEQSHVATARWAMYAALFGVLLLLLRRGRDRRLLLGFTAASVLAVGLYVVTSMLIGGGRELFLGGRLSDPLGYANGQAGYFLVGLWPFVALAEQARKPLLAGLGMAGGLLIACLLLVSQSRGVIPGIAVSAAAMLLLVPGRGRRLWVLIAIGAGLAILAQPLLDVYRETPAGRPAGLPEDVAQAAARAMLLGALAIGLLWTGIQHLVPGPLARTGERFAGALPARAATGAAVVLVVATAIGATVAVNDPVGKVRDQYDDFAKLRVRETRTDTRYLSGGGFRYDYWRIAWRQYRDNPLKGVGAGSYDTTYFRQRRTNEDIRQPHSLELQTLAELGTVGGLALGLFVLAVLAGLRGQSRRARDDDWERVIAVAAGGAFVAWLAHTSVDWLHVIPGVTGIALLAAAVLASPCTGPVRAGLRRPERIGATVAVAIAVVAAAQTVVHPTATESLLSDAREKLSSDPVTALEHADEAIALNGDSMRALYAKSAAYARLDRYAQARAPLIEAARLEPHDHLPWALLGDLAARRGELRRARRYYRQATRLNPMDTRLDALVADPRPRR